MQVELNVGEHEEIAQFMSVCGYKLEYRHFTMAGKQMLAQGIPPERIAHNAIFRPSSSSKLGS